MKKSAIVALALIAGSSFAATSATKTYQVTGPVLEVSDTKFVVQKGSEKWEIAKDASTKIKGDLKAGAKVTVKYTMTATDVEVKAK